MWNNGNPKKRLATRQVDVQRKNLVQMCRLTVKSLIDKSSYEPVDEGSEELVNFFAVMEQLLLFRMRPQKTWYGSEEARHYWDYLKLACRKMSHNCITNIESIENIKTSRGKGRAWLRVALMEKRLSEYITMALQQSKISKNFYLDGSVMLSEDSSMLCGTLLGLNAIDFSFCLKGDNLELMDPLVIDYSPYLHFQQSDSLMEDSEEAGELRNANISSSIMSGIDMDDDGWSVKYKSLENKFRNISEQKGYLEELVRLRQSQLEEATRQRQHLLETLQHYETESMRERQQLECVIIELQGQLVTVKEQLRSLQQELTSLKARVLPQPSNDAQSVIAMKDMASDEHPQLPRQILSNQESDTQSQDSSDLGTSGIVPNPLLVSGETRAMLSRRIMKEETQSLVPLAGSFSSEVSFRSGDLQMSASPKASGGQTQDYEQTSRKMGGSTFPEMESMVHISISDADDAQNWTNDPLQVEGDQGRTGSSIQEGSDVTDLSAADQSEENGNNINLPAEVTTTVGEPNTSEPEMISSQTESSEVRSSPDGEVSEEDKTILSAVVDSDIVACKSETLLPPYDGQQKAGTGDDSSLSDDGRTPPREITVDETSSDNSNGDWTLLPHSEQQDQEVSTSSGDGVVVSGETSPVDLSREEIQGEDHSG